jgi:hypothetical protein
LARGWTEEFLKKKKICFVLARNANYAFSQLSTWTLRGEGMLRVACLLFIVWRTKGAHGCGQTREADDKFFEIK